MPEYLSPGVYIEEISTGAVPIEGVSTSTAGFVGQTERGPTQPTLVTSFTEFQRWFGSFIDTAISYLPFAVKGFFDNGGLRLFVARVAAADAEVTSLNLNAVAPAPAAAPPAPAVPAAGGPPAAAAPPAAAGPSAVAAPPAATRAAATAAPAPVPPSANLTVTSIGPGLWGGRIYVRIKPSTMQSPAVKIPDPVNTGKFITAPSQPVGFRLTALYYSTAPPTTDAQGNSFGNDAAGNPINIVDPLDVNNLRNPYMRTPDVVEDYDNLRIDPKNPDYALTMINPASQLIQLAVPDGTVAVMPASINFTGLLGGSDGTTPLTSADYIGLDTATNELRRGMAGLDIIDEISLLCVPDEVLLPDGAVVTADTVNRCEIRKDRFAILQFNQGMGNITGAVPMPPIDTSYAAIYMPFIRVYDPITQGYPLIPCGGHMAGIYANTDEERGVHKAPANVEILGMLTTDIDSTRKAIEYSFTKGQHDLLNPRGIDVIRDFRSQGLGIRVYGARTMSTDSQWRYINVRRLFIFIEQSIAQGTQWVVFEPNNDTTWARVNRSITNFLTSVWRSGALMGTKAEDAFFVTVDRTTMTQDDIDNGRLICYIGIAPVYPAEFVIFRISQTTIDTSS